MACAGAQAQGPSAHAARPAAAPREPPSPTGLAAPGSAARVARAPPLRPASAVGGWARAAARSPRPWLPPWWQPAACGSSRRLRRAGEARGGQPAAPGRSSRRPRHRAASCSPNSARARRAKVQRGAMRSARPRRPYEGHAPGRRRITQARTATPGRGQKFLGVYNTGSGLQGAERLSWLRCKQPLRSHRPAPRAASPGARASPASPWTARISGCPATSRRCCGR